MRGRPSETSGQLILVLRCVEGSDRADNRRTGINLQDAFRQCLSQDVIVANLRKEMAASMGGASSPGKARAEMIRKAAAELRAKGFPDAAAKVEILEPARHLLLVFQGDTEATWAWGLYETAADKTRLVTRLRVGTGGIRSRLALDAFEIIMMRKCLLGIKLRAESLP